MAKLIAVAQIMQSRIKVDIGFFINPKDTKDEYEHPVQCSPRFNVVSTKNF